MSQRTQTIEQTGKGWKALWLLGMVVGIAGILVIVFGAGSDDPTEGPSPTLGYGLLLCFAGMGLWIISRIGAWWYHG